MFLILSSGNIFSPEKYHLRSFEDFKQFYFSNSEMWTIGLEGKTLPINRRK